MKKALGFILAIIVIPFIVVYGIVGVAAILLGGFFTWVGDGIQSSITNAEAVLKARKELEK